MKGSIAKLPKVARLSEAETHELLRAAQAGDVAARNRLVQVNLRLVMTVVNRVATKTANAVSIDDLFQFAIVGIGPKVGGFMRAIETFDLNGPTKFSTWAAQCVHGAVLDAVSGGLVASRNLRVYTAAAERKRQSLAAALGRQPTDDEIAAAFPVKTTRRRVKAALKHPTTNHISLDAQAEKATEFRNHHDGSGRNIAERMINDPDAITEDDILEAIDVDLLCGRAAAVALRRLSPRERAVLQRRFGFVTGQEETLVDVGRALGIGGERVRIIQRAALAKLRKALTVGSAC